MVPGLRFFDSRFPLIRLLWNQQGDLTVKQALIATIAPLIVCASAVCHSWQGGEAHLSGQVYDAMGSSIGGATVKLMRKAEQIRSVTSDENGRFVIGGVPAGEYLLILESRGFATREVRVDLGTRQIGSIDVCLDIGVHFDHVPSRVSGVVKLTNGLPLVDAVVKVVNPFDQRVISIGRTDSSGRYQLEVYLGGQYVVVVFKPGFKVAAEPMVLVQQKSLDFLMHPLSP